MSEDEWLKAALTEPSLVANLLLQISHNKKALNNKKSQTQTPVLRWQVRQPRSKSTPNTPFLSSDRATSSINTGFEDATSSYVVAKTSTTNNSNKGGDGSENKTTKRSRKKKTLSELKEDEVLVLKERRDLEKKLASLNVTFEIERARNDRLKLEYVCAAKRVKLPVSAEESAKMVSSYDHLSAVSKFCASRPVEQNLSNPPKPNRDNQFMLPDLNLSIEDHNS